MRSIDPAPDLRAFLSRIGGSPPGGRGAGAFADSLRPTLVVRALIIVTTVSLATILRYWLGVQFHVTAPYLTYFPAVLIVASLFGIADGICATLLATAFVDYFFLVPVHTLALHSLGDRVAVLFFFFACVALSFVAGALRSRTWRMHQALEDLRDSEERFFSERRRSFEASLKLATIVASAEEAIIGKDTHGLVTSWNKGAETIFGYAAEEMIGQPIRKLLPPDRQSEEDDILVRVLRNESVEMSDAIRIAKGGHTVHVSLHVSPIRDEAGNIVGASKVAHDITETIKLQRQLQQSQKMEAIGQLAGGIAHDFNNLLAIVLGALELQRASIEENPAALHRWEVANRAAMRGAELTRRLLAFSSVGHFKVTTIDLNHSIRNTVEMANRLLGPEIIVDLNLERDMAKVCADPSGLESAVLNMVINARDAMPKGGRLTVSTRTAELERSFTQTLTGAIEPGKYACISITDTGTGMSQEVLDRVCEPFFTTKERGRGTGLGLSMVYGFVKHSGGGIRIYSEVGYGTTITFYLPFETAEHAAAAQDLPAPAKQTELRRTGSILIVDDEGELLEISVSYLEARGYTLLSAHSGSEALDLLSENGPVDVLVTDIVMGGGMDGMELAQAVRILYPQTLIIYSSGFPADALSTRSLPLADSLVLQKPYRLSELGASIDQALGIRQILMTSSPTHAAPIAEDAFAGPASSNPFN